MADSDSTSGRAPAFQFYPKDFLADERVRLMSLQERGAYITLICHCWSEGSIPADVGTMAKVIGTPEAPFRKLWPSLSQCFRPASNDASRLIHPRLEREIKKQRAFRRKQAENGRKGGRPPQSGKPTANPSLSPRTNQSPSSVFGSESGSGFHLHTAVKERAPADPVQRVVDRHEELHRQFVGIGYIGNPHSDYDAARRLVVAIPEEEMQDAVLVYGLNDTSNFMASGNRTIAKIASKASEYTRELKAKKLA